MLTTLLITGIFLTALFVSILANRKDDLSGLSITATVISVLAGIACFINIILLLTGPASTRSDIKEFEAAKTTITAQRADSLSSYERVTLTQTIIKQNQWLAKAQFWAKSPWQNWYYDKSVLDVKPIE